MDKFDDILAEAFAVAAKATEDYLTANPDLWYPCGFAWVTIRPARGPFITHLKKKSIGENGTYGGWEIWNPSGNSTQCMDAKQLGARAFANVLKKHGIACTPHTRID